MNKQSHFNPQEEFDFGQEPVFDDAPPSDDGYENLDFSAQANSFTEGEWFDDGYADLPPEAFEPGFGHQETSFAKVSIPLSLTQGMNPPQKEAVETLEGALMVVAGPGSGKTRVLTHRIAALVATNSAQPWQILAVTFTNKAAAEMRERISALVGSAANDMWVSTFHSACVRILRANAQTAGLPKTFSIVDSNDSQKLIKGILTDFMMPDEKQDVRHAASVISRTKNAALTSLSLASTHDAHLAVVMDEYNTRLTAMGSVDFDDILLKTLKLLNTDDDARARYQKKFKYVLVDEYQDTNAVQYQITQILAAKSKNLCVVGDLDQSVYSWRGATPEAMGGFSSDYPNAKVVILEQNYRSTKAIVETYRSIIASNPALHRPNLFTDNDEGEPVRMVTAATDRNEADFVVKELKAKPSGETTAILMRTNPQTRVFEEALTRSGIAYTVVGALRFYDRAEVKDALSYLRFALNPLDSVSFARCVNTPRRGIGDATVQKVVLAARENKSTIIEGIETCIENGELKGRAASSLKKFIEIYEEIVTAAEEGPAAGLKAVSSKAGLKEALEADKEQGPDRVANLQELINGALLFENSSSATNPDVKKIEDLSGLEKTMTFLENVALVSAADTDVDPSAHRAVILTAHASKGKEFDHVWVVGVEEGLFPHQKSVNDDAAIEEERRLLFVACSRPRLTLTLSRAKSRMSFGKISENNASRFIDELPPSVIKSNASGANYQTSNHFGALRPSAPSFGAIPKTVTSSKKFNSAPKRPRGPRIEISEAAVGMRVEHVVFGEGVVTSLEETRASIDFSDATRILDLTIAPLKKL